jgi:predicted  nucleic acid-binding Zn-ribbon protein
MAKTEKEYTVPEKLGNLYKLQIYVSEIDRIKSLRGELPLEVEDLEVEVERLTTRIEKFRADIAEHENRIKAKQQDIENAQALINKYAAQQEDVKNNKEYEFLSKEIEYQSLEIELCNKRINEANNAIVELRDKETSAMAELNDRRSDLEVKKSELDEIIAETRSEEETLREKAKKLENTIEPRLLATFKRIHKNTHNGLAIVPIERDACGGCFNKIAPQRRIDVGMRKKIIVCEYCGRILIDAALAEENEIRRRRKSTISGL